MTNSFKTLDKDGTNTLVLKSYVAELKIVKFGITYSVVTEAMSLEEARAKVLITKPGGTELLSLRQDA